MHHDVNSRWVLDYDWKFIDKVYIKRPNTLMFLAPLRITIFIGQHLNETMLGEDPGGNTVCILL